MTNSYLVMVKIIKPTLRQSLCKIWYDGNSNSGLKNDIKFVDVDLSCNKWSLWLLINDFITRIRKKHIAEINDDVNKALKVKATQEKKISVKQLGKKSSKYQSLFPTLLVNLL